MNERPNFNWKTLLHKKVSVNSSLLHLLDTGYRSTNSAVLPVKQQVCISFVYRSEVYTWGNGKMCFGIINA